MWLCGIYRRSSRLTDKRGTPCTTSGGGDRRAGQDAGGTGGKKRRGRRRVEGKEMGQKRSPKFLEHVYTPLEIGASLSAAGSRTRQSRLLATTSLHVISRCSAAVIVPLH